MRVTASADGIGQQQAVEPRVDDAVARTQRDTATVADEVGQLAVHLHIHRLGVGRGVAKRLHHQIGGEAEAREVLEFVAGHRAGGVLRTDRSHARLAVGAWADAGAFRQTARAADHLLRQGVTLARIDRWLWQAERRGCRQAKELASLGGECATDDEVDTAAGTHLVEQHIAFERKFGDRGAALGDLAVVGEHVDDVAHLKAAHVHFDWQRARVFLGVEEDRRDLATQGHAAEALVRHEGDVFSGGPDHRIGG